MRARNLAILTQKLAWSNLYIYLILKPKDKLIRNYEY